jgi:3'-phosphoadenosine 5'-phosphosulfate (PAPS) 3'-phosphatase
LALFNHIILRAKHSQCGPGTVTHLTPGSANPTDRRVEAYVLRALNEFCPTLPVVAEESYENQMAGVTAPEAPGAPAAPAYGTTVIAKGGCVVTTPRTAAAEAALADAAGWPPYLLKPVDVVGLYMLHEFI